MAIFENLSISQDSNNSPEKAKPNKFVIPRLNKKKPLLQQLTEDDKDEAAHIEKMLIESHINNESEFKTLGYALTQIHLVNNDVTDDIYAKKRKEMKSKCVNKGDIQERNLFYKVNDEDDMKEIVSEGFKCIDTLEEEKNVLSTSEMGITFGKNLDIILRNEYKKKRHKTFYIILSKVFLTSNKGKFITPHMKNRESDPDNKYEYHISAGLPNLENDITKQFYDSLFYIYEYDEDGEHYEKPRNILPYAVIKYELEKGVFTDKNITKGQSNKKSVIYQRSKEQINNYRNKFIQRQNNLAQKQISQLTNSLPIPAQINRKNFEIPILRADQPNNRKKFEIPNLRVDPRVNISHNTYHYSNQYNKNNNIPLLPNPSPPPYNFVQSNLKQQEIMPIISQNRDSRIQKNIPEKYNSSTQPNTSSNLHRTPPQIESWTTCITNEEPICRINAVTSLNTSAQNENPQIIEQLNSNNEINNDEESPRQRSAACTFNPNFKAPTPPPVTKTSIYSDDDESDDGKDLLELFEEWYGDLYKEGALRENIPKWRLHYELTGRVDKVFRGGRRIKINVTDVKNTLIFNNSDRVDLNDPTNKLILSYQKKKLNKPLINKADAKPCPVFGEITPKPQRILDSEMPCTSASVNSVIYKHDNEEKVKHKEKDHVREFRKLAKRKMAEKRKREEDEKRRKSEEEEKNKLITNIKEEVIDID